MLAVNPEFEAWLKAYYADTNEEVGFRGVAGFVPLPTACMRGGAAACRFELRSQRKGNHIHNCSLTTCCAPRGGKQGLTTCACHMAGRPSRFCVHRATFLRLRSWSWTIGSLPRCFDASYFNREIARPMPSRVLVYHVSRIYKSCLYNISADCQTRPEDYLQDPRLDIV